MKKRKFSPCIHTWKLRRPTAANQIQYAFCLRLQLPLLLVPMLVLQNEAYTVQSLQCPEKGRQEAEAKGGQTTYIDRRGKLRWKVKGSMLKTKFLVSSIGHDVLKRSGKYPCAVHKRFSGITERLVADLNYVCPRFDNKAWSIDFRTLIEVDIDCTMLDVEATFCYLGDMLCSGGGCESAVALDGVWPGESSGNTCLS